MQEEVWKEVPGYEGLYNVSNLGRVYSYKTKRVLSTPINSVGYKVVNLKRGKQFKIHCLVAMAFLNHKPSGFKMVVDHIDNDKSNNNVANLQVISNRRNLKKDRKNDTSKHLGVSFNAKNKKWVARIYFNGSNLYLGSYNCELLASNVVREFLNAQEI
jgi:hypothetical protein